MFSFLSRNWSVLNPPVKPAKTTDALRIGLLGASAIAPMAVITPALSHPEVIVVAVAARDHQRATAFAKKHGIPIVHASYQDLIDDPSIDIIYNPLPNGLHYEWTLKALKAGKHVLFEKPSVSNASEASSLFNHPLLSGPKAPILLEAFHSRFHPAFQTFLALVAEQGREQVVSAEARLRLYRGMFPLTDIRFSYPLAGGSVMDPGTYLILALRMIFGEEPSSCLDAEAEAMPRGYDERIDRSMRAAWTFPNGGTGKIDTSLSATGGYWFSFLTSSWPSFSGLLPTAKAGFKEIIIQDPNITVDEEHAVATTITIHNFIAPHLWHRIDLSSLHTIRKSDTKETIKTWEENQSKKVYKSENEKGEEWWSTYRYQLEAFVDRVKGRTGPGVNEAWISGEESISQMQMIDSAYVKSGLGVRPTSEFRIE